MLNNKNILVVVSYEHKQADSTKIVYFWVVPIFTIDLWK